MDMLNATLPGGKGVHDLLMRLVARLGATLHVVASAEESEYFSRVDRELDLIERHRLPRGERRPPLD